MILQDGALLYERHAGVLKRMDLGLSGDPHFIRNRNGTPRVKRTEWGTVVAIAKITKLPESSDCKTTIKGIVIKGGRLYLSPKVKRGSMCGLGPKDDLLFINLAHALHDQRSKKARTE